MFHQLNIWIIFRPETVLIHLSNNYILYLNTLLSPRFTVLECEIVEGEHRKIYRYADSIKSNEINFAAGNELNVSRSLPPLFSLIHERLMLFQKKKKKKKRRKGGKIYIYLLSSVLFGQKISLDTVISCFYVTPYSREF